MKIGIAVILFAVLALIGAQVWSFYGRERALARQLSDLRTRYESAEKDYHSLEADYEYYKNPANLEKELRARFNYRSPDEKTIIIVPSSPATSSVPPTSQ